MSTCSENDQCSKVHRISGVFRTFLLLACTAFSILLGTLVWESPTQGLMLVLGAWIIVCLWIVLWAWRASVRVEEDCLVVKGTWKARHVRLGDIEDLKMIRGSVVVILSDNKRLVLPPYLKDATGLMATIIREAYFDQAIRGNAEN